MFDLSKDGGAGDQGSSPMVGADGTIYMGASTTDKNISSSLYAIHPDGTQKWRYELGIGTNIPYISPATFISRHTSPNSCIIVFSDSLL